MRYEDASHTAFQGNEPIARDDSDALPAGTRGPATGNLISGEGTQTGSAGADQAAGAHITSIAGKGGEDSSFSGGKLSVAGEFGKLSVDADGNYSYLANGGVENVRDRFVYTLADSAGQSDTAALIVEIGKTPVVIKANAQQIVPGPNGVVTLPPGVQLSDVMVVGRNLVVNLPDGTQLVIVDGAVFVPQLVLDGVEVPATNLAALLIGQEPQPAAGETPVLSSGGNFDVPVPPLDPGVPLGDLIPPTEYGYIPPEPEEIGQFLDREPEIFVQPDGQPASVAAVDTVEEAGLPTRNGGEPAGSGESADGNGADNDVTSETTGGTIIINSPDGVDSVTINGVLVTGIPGQTIAGAFGTLTITGFDGDDILYSYTLNDNTSGNNTHDDFAVVLTDDDGDQAAATLRIDIIDDVPTARPDTDALAIGQNVATGNVLTDASAGDAGDSDAGADTVGADNATITAVSSANVPANSDNGAPFVVNGQYGVLTLQADGNYSYTRNPDSPGGVQDVFNYTLTDGDGDTSSTTLTITIPDATPTLPDPAAVLLDDDALANGNPGGSGDDVDSAGTPGVLAGTGGDGDLDYAFTGTNTLPAGFTVNVVNPGQIQILQGATVVLTVTLNTETGAYTVVQNNPIVHPSLNGAAGDNTENNLSFGIGVQVVDADGDTDGATITINVDDDTPIALEAQVTGTVDEDGVPGGIAGGTGDVAGEATVANGSVASLFASGADTPLTYSLLSDTSGLPALTSNGVAVTYSVAGNTLTASAGGNTVFTFTLQANGSWTFTLVDQLDHPTLNGQAGDNTENDLSIALGSIIQATDNDGDSITALAGGLVITVDDDIPVANNDVDSIVGGNGPATGNVLTGVDSPGGDANGTDGVADQGGADAPTTITGLASNNVPANVDNNPAGGFVVNGQYGTLTLNADGSYSYLRTDGSAGSKQDVFTYTITDADGDSVSATLTINITDNAPTLPDPATVLLDDDALANGNPGGTGDDPNSGGLPGQLAGSGGDGDLDYAFTGINNLPAGFSVNVVNAGQVQILQGATVVLTVTLDTETGAFNVVQNNPINHPTLNGAAGDNEENNLSFSLGVQVVDADGDTDGASITINVDDDTPIATATLLTGTVDEDGVPSGLAGGPGDVAGTATAASGNVASLFASGADTPLTYALLNNFAGLPNLTSGGVAVTYGVNFAAGVYTLTASAGGNTVFTFTLNATTGAYTFTLVDQIDHPTLNGQPGDNTENDLAIALGSIIQATDNDGDSVTANANGLVITVDDDTPIAGNDSDSIPGGGDITTGNVITGAGTDSGAAGADSSGADVPASVTALASNNVPANSDNSGPFVVVGQYGTLTMQTDGSYSYDRADGSPGNVQDVFTYTYTDADGDSVTATLTIGIADSAPVLPDPALVRLDDDALANGNPGGTGDDPNSAGLPGQLVGAGGDGDLDYAFTGVNTLPAGFSVNVVNAGQIQILQGATVVLTVTLDTETGAFNVVQNNPINHPTLNGAAGDNEENNLDFSIGVQVVDQDGDTEGASISINVDDDTPIATATLLTGTVDEDGVPGGIAGGTGDVAGEATVANGSVATLFASGADTPLTYSLLTNTSGLPALTSNGAAVTYSVVGNTLTASANGGTVFTFVLNANGTYTFTLSDQLDHPTLNGQAGDNTENDLSIALGSIIQATDNDGDSVTANANGLVITVDDDTPTAAISTAGLSISIDESTGNQADSNDVSGPLAVFNGVANKGDDPDVAGTVIQFGTSTGAVGSGSSAVGADAPGSIVKSLDVSSAGVDSGLNTTDGQDILLYNEGGIIVGRVGSQAGPAAFALAIDPVTGVISMVEYLSIQHPNAANADDSVSIANGAVLAVVTVSDADGDTTSTSTAIGNLISFQDSGPIMTAAQNMNIQNSGDVAHTAAFAFNLGADGANTSNNVITNVTGSATVGGVAVQNWTLTPGAENATTASYSFSFDYPIGGGNTAHATGTLVFDKVAGTYTVDLDNPIQGVTTILQTAQGTLFQGYEFGTSTPDGSQPAISVTQIQDQAGTANDIYVQFTSVSEPSSGTGDDNLEVTNWVPGANNPPPVNGGGDNAWNAGQLFNQVDGWVSTSNSANGVDGDTIQGGEVLDFSLVKGANPTGTLANPSTYAQASAMFLKFDGIGSSEDMIVILKLYDPNTNQYTTRAIMIENGDIQKGPGSGPGQYSGITLDNNDGLVIIESNDYNNPGENWVIVGAQIAGSDEGVTGTAINLNSAIGAGDSDVDNNGSLDTDALGFQSDTDDGPFKISSIGFLTTSTTPQNAHFDFNVTVTDGDGDSITQAVSVDVTAAADSVSAATIPAGNTTISQTPLSSKSSAAISESLQKTADNSNTVTMAAAVGAAGMADSAAAAETSDQSSRLAADAPVQNSVASVDQPIADSGDGGSSVAAAPEAQQADEAPGNSGGHSQADEHRADASLDAASNHEAAGDHPADQAANDQGPAAAADAQAAAPAPTVMMASAEALKAVGLEGNNDQGGDHVSPVEQVVAEALGHGAAPTVDALLAGLENGAVGALHQLASPAFDNAPAWDMGAHGGFATAADVLIKMGADMAHHDAVQPAVNG